MSEYGKPEYQHFIKEQFTDLLNQLIMKKYSTGAMCNSPLGQRPLKNRKQFARIKKGSLPLGADSCLDYISILIHLLIGCAAFNFQCSWLKSNYLVNLFCPIDIKIVPTAAMSNAWHNF